MVSIEVRSMTENTCWKGLNLIFRKKLVAIGLKESIKVA
jgi:hypothetical protein